MGRTIAWTLSLLAAAIALFVVALHMSFVEVNYVLLVAVALFHGFYGLHTILTEYWTSSRAGALISGLCVATGSGLFLLVVLTEVVSS